MKHLLLCIYPFQYQVWSYYLSVGSVQVGLVSGQPALHGVLIGLYTLTVTPFTIEILLEDGRLSNRETCIYNQNNVLKYRSIIE